MRIKNLLSLDKQCVCNQVVIFFKFIFLKDIPEMEAGYIFLTIITSLFVFVLVLFVYLFACDFVLLLIFKSNLLTSGLLSL